MLAGEPMRQLVGRDDNKDHGYQEGQRGELKKTRRILDDFVPMKNADRDRRQNRAGGQEQELPGEEETASLSQRTQETIRIKQPDSQIQQFAANPGARFPRSRAIALLRLKQTVLVQTLDETGQCLGSNGRSEFLFRADSDVVERSGAIKLLRDKSFGLL